MKTRTHGRRSKSIILALALILGLLLGSVSVYAADANNDKFDDVSGQPINAQDTIPAISANGAHVSKIVKYNEHQTFDLTFNYEATATQIALLQTYDAATDTVDEVKTQPVSACPAVTINPIRVVADANTTYSADGLRVPKANMTDEELAANTQGVITFGTGSATGAAAFPHAGVYVYEIAETAGATSGFAGQGKTDHLTYDTQKYTMRVYVENDSNGGLVIRNITMQNSDGDKVSRSGVAYTNTYVETADPLEVKKLVSGSGADTTKEFNFTVVFTAPSTIRTMAEGTPWDPTEITVAKKDASGDVVSTDVTVDEQGTARFALKHNEEMIFDNLPVGATYVVRETGLAGSGYTPTGQAVQNNQTRTAHVGSRDTDFTSDSAYVGESTNSYTITNQAEDITITGLVMNNLPVFLLVALAGAAVAAYALLRRKIAAR